MIRFEVRRHIVGVFLVLETWSILFHKTWLLLVTTLIIQVFYSFVYAIRDFASVNVTKAKAHCTLVVNVLLTYFRGCHFKWSINFTSIIFRQDNWHTHGVVWYVVFFHIDRKVLILIHMLCLFNQRSDGVLLTGRTSHTNMLLWRWTNELGRLHLMHLVIWIIFTWCLRIRSWVTLAGSLTVSSWFFRINFFSFRMFLSHSPAIYN